MESQSASSGPEIEDIIVSAELQVLVDCTISCLLKEKLPYVACFLFCVCVWLLSFFC